MTHIRTALIAGAIGLLASGCYKRHREPAVEERHALLKYRTYYAASYDATLEEWIRINRRRVGGGSSVGSGDRKRMDIVRLQPGPSTLSVTSRFSQQVTTHGPNGTGTARVNLAECGRSLQLVARDGAVYFLEYEFEGPMQCTLECQEQVFGDNRRTWTWKPCETGYFPNE